MSAMSDADLVLREYDATRRNLVRSTGGLTGYLEAVENFIKAADAAVKVLRETVMGE
ncbi:MAG TPA: hypothetical protein VJ777_13505 [Mycobacterium sp.]|nr:hypothetical protein [Mycobacterium sp.]